MPTKKNIFKKIAVVLLSNTLPHWESCHWWWWKFQERVSYECLLELESKQLVPDNKKQFLREKKKTIRNDLQRGGLVSNCNGVVDTPT